METSDHARLRALIGLESGQVTLLRSFSGKLLDALPGILDGFYANLQQQAWAHQYIQTPQAWRRHRDALRGWVVAVLTQEDTEIEDLLPRVADAHVTKGIHGSWIIGAAAYLRTLIVAELSTSPQWSVSAFLALEHRWSYAIALMQGAYEDRWRGELSHKNDELQSALDERDQRVREVAGLNKMLQQMMSSVPLEHAEGLEAVEIVRTMERLLAS